MTPFSSADRNPRRWLAPDFDSGWAPIFTPGRAANVTHRMVAWLPTLGRPTGHAKSGPAIPANVRVILTAERETKELVVIIEATPAKSPGGYLATRVQMGLPREPSDNTAHLYPSEQSSHTFPCISKRPNAFAFFVPTSWLLSSEFRLYQAKRSRVVSPPKFPTSSPKQ